MASRHSNTAPGLGRTGSRTQQSNGARAMLNNWVDQREQHWSVKKDNSEREREATLSRDTTPTSSRGRGHTPHSYPRTKHRPHLAFENLRRPLPFDETSTDNDDPLEILSIQSEDNQSQDSGVQDATPDSNQIVGRLMQIRDYLKQATAIKESLEKDSPGSQEQLSRIDKLCNHLKEQEEGYLALLQKMLADRSNGSEVLNNQREMGNGYSMVNGVGHAVVAADGGEDEDSDVSLGVDAVSEVSDCTTDLTWNASSRPGIESHMGFLSDLSSLPNSTPTTSSGSSGTPTSTLLAPPRRSNTLLVRSNTDELANTLTAERLAKRPRSGGQSVRAVQSNVDVYIADEVDGCFHRHSNESGNATRSSGKSVSPRLKQTNIPLMNVSNQPFDELVGVEFAEEVMSSSDGFEVSTQGNSVDEQQSDKEAEVRALKQQRDLLKKMLDQQKMLKTLHERQAELLELQRKSDAAEEGAAAADVSQQREGNPQRAHNSVVVLSDEDKDRDEKEDEGDDESSDTESDTTEVSGDGYGEPPPTEEEPEVPAELQALRQRLLYLKNVFDENLGQQMDDQQKLEALRQMQAAAGSGEQMPTEEEMMSAGEESNTSAGEESECSNPERRKLRRRLNELQDKKEQMESLLGELQTLRQYRTTQEAAGDTSASESTVTGRAIREQQEMARSADVTAGQAETVLDVMEQESKLRKLEEVRGRLHQLRDLVQYYQGDQEEVSSTVDSEVTEGQDLSLMGNIQSGRQLSVLTDSVADTSDADSSISLGDFGNDPEIQEKVRKLESARERLARLQSLVSMVQQWPEAAEVLPEDLAELAATAMDDTASEVSTLSKTSTVSGAQRFSALYDVSLRKPKNSNVEKATSTQSRDTASRANQKASNTRSSNQRSPRGQIRSHQQASPSSRANEIAQEREEVTSATESATTSVTESEAFYLLRMEEQKQELQNLMNERNKLLNIQNELKSLHQQYTQSAPQELSALLNGNNTRDTSQSSSAASRGGDGKSSARSAVTFSSQPAEFSEPPNILYSRMLEQKMARQESRRTRGEEDQMTADVTTLATWGESESSSTTSDGSSAESDDEDTPNDEGEIEEDDDGYPSDGILQVEEEEEAIRDSDRDTYTVEDEYQYRQRYPVDLPSKSRRQKRPHTHKLKEAGNPAAGDYWKPLPTAGGAVAVNSQGVQGAQGALGSGTDMISTMKDQLDATTDMCQHLLQKQRKLALQMKDDYQPPNSESWIENRVMYSINQLYSKIMDMQAALQVTVDQVYAITQHLERKDMVDTSSGPGVRGDGAGKLNRVSSSSQAGGGIRSQVRPSTLFDLAGNPFTYSLGSDRQSSLASSAVEQSDGDKTPTQLFPPQNSGRSEATTEADSKTESVRQFFADHSYSIPPLDLDQLIKRRQAQSKSLDAAGNTGPTYPSPSLSAIAAGRVRVPLESMYKPGISSGICGTAYADTASLSSAVSSVRGTQSGNNTPLSTPGKERGAVAMSAKDLASTKARTSQDSAASDLSLFEALRETIYSEVATLISQNENRPHFLIELFRELQMLSSDYLRQRGLYSIQELVTKFLTEDVSSQRLQLDTDTESDILAPQPAWMLYRGTGSEQTPSESCVTTDEDEVRQMLSTKHKLTPVNSAANISGTARLERVGSIKSDFADYIEQVETISTNSTSQSQTGGAWEDPFNQDSLGDTVIHLEKAMQKVKDIDRRKEAKRETKREEKRSKPAAESETGSSSSAHDIGSDNEGSTDVQMTRIDTQKLDRQIKQIMTEIIPVLREHMDNVCSSQLLQYVQQKVIELTAQTGDQSKPERAVEFTQFFQKQLFNILRDSLAKFEGRRMRDCGEEILVDISEILFNELAFFKLMQDLDDPEVKDRIALNKWRAAGGETPIAHIDTDTDGTSTVESSAVISGMDGEDVNGESEESSEEDIEAEQENLGKDRDDAFADEVNTSESREATFTDVHYELAPSETKPMTRIGSDEDCSGDDDDSSEISTDDGDDTAISRLTAQDQNAKDQSESSGQSSNQSVEEQELAIDDLPAKLDVDMEAIAARAAAEEELLAAPTADVLPEMEPQLAGSSSELKKPEPAEEGEVVKEPTVEDTAAEDTAAVETAAVDTAAVDTAAVDTAAVDTAAVDTAVVDTAAEPSSGADPSAETDKAAADVSDAPLVEEVKEDIQTDTQTPPPSKTTEV